MVSSIALIDTLNEKFWVVDISPDIKDQLYALGRYYDWAKIENMGGNSWGYSRILRNIPQINFVYLMNLNFIFKSSNSFLFDIGSIAFILYKFFMINDLLQFLRA